MREQVCDRATARERAEFARTQFELAELGEPWPVDVDRKASGACAVLAAIAASDALCCSRLGRRSRGQDHREALAMLRLIEPAGNALARDLEVALGAKDLVHYGTNLLSADRHKHLLRAVERVVVAADASTST